MTDRFDIKLFLLRLLRKFHILLMGAVLGGILIGGGYAVKKLVIDKPLYQTRIVAHEDLYFDTEIGQYTYINRYTWNEIVAMDWITDEISENLSGKYSSDEISALLTAEVPSDSRIVYVYVTSEDKEKTAEVAKATVPVIESVSDKLPEIQDVLIMDVYETPKKVDNAKYLLRACILGAVLGLLAALFGRSVYILMDDSIYIPELFEKKYGIETETFDGNIPEGALVLDKSLPDLTGISEGETEVYVVSGAHNGKIVEHVLYELKKRNVKVTKAYLTNAKIWLIKGFYAGTRFPDPFMK